LFTAADFAALTEFTGSATVEYTSWAVAKITEWLKYQAFTQFCVCKVPAMDPTANCVHARNIVIPGSINAVVSLGLVRIEDFVYDSWTRPTTTQWNVERTAGYIQFGGPTSSHDWDVQLQLTSGTWASVDSNLTMPSGTPTRRTLFLSGAPGLFPRTVAMRILNPSAVPHTITSLDWCFVPHQQDVPPVPTQPDLPSLPVVPPPVCSTEDLCSIVLELARSVSRLSAQLSDVQQLVGGVDQVVPQSSQPISGEGEITLAPGIRGVSIELTVLGSSVYTSALGRPRGLMRAGSIRWGDGVGYSQRDFIDADRFDRLRPQGALTVSYQLLAGTSGVLKLLS
jgi:hypothetical protein